ncbi:MAG: molybdopterin-guanine dinucleotide biosynthesis protein B [Syntrophobacteraceae bacterium CG2_30_61_12]|nr:MAG: molybdopterin-guanine dinucleotide biosynthesis protein B [Syntrophobacteraceae bacterium CG2_30_61_12]PIU32279.1 MAG: molybdopterin-guanine dinucleotide biosynthesis protein B [Syntrophobacteraceae bacterium CG07_land_8_20_14_0_80_61_8]
MIPIICIVGSANVGKTTVLEQLIPALKRRGYRVGALKHDVHGFEMDHQGKDTWKHKRAGADTIAIAGPTQVASIRSTAAEMPIEETVARYFWSERIVLAEGYKRSHFPKIEVFRAELAAEPLCTEPGDNLIAMVSDDPPPVEVPCYGFQQIDELAALLEERYLKERKQHPVEVRLDGKKLPLKGFVQDIIQGALRGMLSSLRGWKEPNRITVEIQCDGDPDR